MQDMREYRRDQSGNLQMFRDTLAGTESKELLDQFRVRREQLEKRIQDGTTESATVTEARRIGRNDPCPCGSNAKFKNCCGSRLSESDERIKK
jgi:preprotein translocase subunit SecA